MDFFGQQDVARRKTLRLVIYFALATLVTVIAVHVAASGVGVMIYEYSDSRRSNSNRDRYGDYHAPGDYGVIDGMQPKERVGFTTLLFDPMLFLATAGITTLVIVGGSAYKTMELSGGGESVASMMGGRRIQSNTTDLGERQLLNVVEEMSLASGVPVPPVYVLDDETSINAFAAGYTIHDAVIAVSKGAVDYLNRDELQGVIAHEFSHVLNGDMKLNLRLVGIVYGLLVIAIIGLYVIRVSFYSGGGGRSRDAKGALAMAAMGFALCAIGVIGYGLGTLIKLSISRQREYLADAAAVQFTRNPAGIGGALKKIGGRRNTSKIINQHAVEMNHFFIANAFGRTTGSLFTTHPPLTERIRRIDPSFDGKYPEVRPIKRHWQEEAQRGAKKTAGSRDPFAPIMDAIPIDTDGAATVGGPLGAAGAAGMPSGVRLAYVAALLQNLPPQLRTATHEAFGARAVVFATLIDRDPEVRAKQLQILRDANDLACVQEVELLLKSADKMEDNARLPLVETALPNLKSLSPEQYGRFRSTLTELIKADGRVDLFEYAVQTLVIRHLDIHFGKKQPAMIRHHHSAIRAILPEAVRLLSTLAYAGAQKNGDAAVAFEKGIEVLKSSAIILPKDQCSLGLLSETLNKLNDAAPLLKHQVVDACVAVVLADEKVTPKEHELTQVIGAILEVPIPPLEG